jgi:hypothetical protein
MTDLKKQLAISNWQLAISNWQLANPTAATSKEVADLLGREFRTRLHLRARLDAASQDINPRGPSARPHQGSGLLRMTDLWNSS